MKHLFISGKTLSYFILICNFFLSTYCIAQGKKIPVTISLYNESTSMPFTKVFSLPLHPGIAISTEFDYNKSPVKSRIFQTLGVNYYYHKHFNQAVTFLTEFGYEYRFKVGIELSALLGLGYMRGFRTKTEYEYKNGGYVIAKNVGVGRVTPSFSMETGYYLSSLEKNNIKIFARYQIWIEFPFSPGFIALLPHSNFHLGVKFFI